MLACTLSSVARSPAVVEKMSSGSVILIPMGKFGSPWSSSVRFVWAVSVEIDYSRHVQEQQQLGVQLDDASDEPLAHRGKGGGSSNTHHYFHDLVMEDVNRGRYGYSQRIIFNLFIGSTRIRWFAWENIDIQNAGGKNARGNAAYGPGVLDSGPGAQSGRPPSTPAGRSWLGSRLRHGRPER